MAFKKIMNSGAPIVIAGSNLVHLYPVGYKYSYGGHTYKVIRSFVADNTEMREIQGDDGVIQSLTIESIIKDHDFTKNGGFKVEILDPDK